ncbi:MAG: hypothetical protein ACR2H3_02700 [Acidimicrobiales bacterium]
MGAAEAYPSTPSKLTALSDLAQKVAPVILAGSRTMPLRPDLTAVLPAMRRGTVIEIDGRGATSLALAMASGSSAAGSWVAVVGLPALSMVAAAEAGLDLERTAVVVDPGERWATVVAALTDAIDVVLTGRPARLRPADARRLTSRVRERGSVLMVVGGSWPDRTDLHLTVESAQWSGLGDGHGYLRKRRMEIILDGRGAAGRRRRRSLEI